MSSKAARASARLTWSSSQPGFTGVETYVSDAFSLPLGPRHTAKTEAGTYLIDAEKGLFAAGDAKRGPSLVVWAIHEGLACAEQIDRYLN